MRVKRPKHLIKKWQGIKNCDTGEVTSGYLYFWEDESKTSYIGHSVQWVKNRKEAIEKYYSN
jgi:hypothetical protein